MEKVDRLLTVGGTGRDVGKTEFICWLIGEFSRRYSVYGFKVSAVYPGEECHHGTHDKNRSTMDLFEEKDRTLAKDTSRMLRAGATKVFYLRSEDKNIVAGYHEFILNVPQEALVVCESNSLAEFIKPGLSIVVTNPDKVVKTRARHRLKQADLVVVSDGISSFTNQETVAFSRDRGWYLLNDLEK